MKITKEQRDIIRGSRGETMARVMKTVALYGQTQGAERLVPITSSYDHFIFPYSTISMEPVYELLQKLSAEGVSYCKPFTVGPRFVDKAVPMGLKQKRYCKKQLAPQQEKWEARLKPLSHAHKGGFTCACYLNEVGNKPRKGDILAWSQPSAVIYANSVLGARCNRNAPLMDIMCSVIGVVPYFGLLTDEGRKASWVVKIRTTKQPDPQLLGAALGQKVQGDVPYIVGMKKWLGTELTEAVCGYLKDFGAAATSVGSMGLYHIGDLTPEAKEMSTALIREDYRIYEIDDEELERIRSSYPVPWKREKAKADLCIVGCPHMSLSQLINWTLKVERALQDVERKKVYIPTVFTAAPGVIRKFKETEYAEILKDTGVILSDICPLMFMRNPYSNSMRVITPSNKLCTCTTARYYPEDEILGKITKGGSVT